MRNFISAELCFAENINNAFKNYFKKLFWAVEAVVADAANVRAILSPPGSVQRQSPFRFHGQDCGNHTNLKIFMALIWLVLAYCNHNYSSGILCPLSIIILLLAKNVE